MRRKRSEPSPAAARSAPQAAPVESVDLIAQRLSASLAATARGLGLFLESLQNGGFAEAGKSYQQLQWVLLAQKDWARASRRFELDPEWKKIASNASALHSLFATLASIMEPLRWVDGSVPQIAEPAAAARFTEECVCDALKKYAIVPTPHNAAVLAELETAGFVEPRGRGRSKRYRLNEGVCVRIANAASALAPRPPE